MADGAIFAPDTARLILDVVKYLQATGFVLRAGMQYSSAPTYTPGPILIRNENSESIPAFACVQTTGTVEYASNNYVLVDKPVDDSGTAGGYLFNGPSVVEEDGLAFAGPFVRALIDETSTPTSGLKYAPTVGEWYLTEDDGGLFTAAGADDIEEDVARIFVGGSSSSMLGVCRLKQSWNNGVASSDIYVLDGTAYTDTGEDANVYDPLSIFSSLTTGDFGLILKQAGKWYIIQAACPQ